MSIFPRIRRLAAIPYECGCLVVGQLYELDSSLVAYEIFLRLDIRQVVCSSKPQASATANYADVCLLLSVGRVNQETEIDHFIKNLDRCTSID